MAQPYERDGFTGCEVVGIHDAFKKGDVDLVRSLLRNPRPTQAWCWPEWGNTANPKLEAVLHPNTSIAAITLLA
ncbi:MAG: hypothetical protein JO187_10425 [Acidobacteria bacterium]|nr:hypothetical protein [Acidobacteriota bacterium]